MSRSNLGKCPRCQTGDMAREDDEVFCLACGYRVDAPADEPTSPSAAGDPMAQLIDAARTILQALTRRASAHQVEASKQQAESNRRLRQAKRVEKALKILEEPDADKAPVRRGGLRGPSKCPKCGHGWASLVHRQQCKGGETGATA